jgi:hypothetical protein
MKRDFSPFASIVVSTGTERIEQRRTATTSRMQLTFIDGSVLHVRENHISATGWVDYAYQWQLSDHQLIRRWDNAHEVPGITTSPHHQHIGSEDNVHPSEPMTLEKVLAFIVLQLAQ